MKKRDKLIKLKGKFNIIGRSIVIHSTAAGAPRLDCFNIYLTGSDSENPPAEIEAKVKFDGEAEGHMCFRQSADDASAPTTLYSYALEC